MLHGIVKKVTQNYLIINFENNIDGLLKRQHMMLNDSFKTGDKIKVCLIDISKNEKKLELKLSRTCNEMLIELFKIAVPEINDGLIEIKAVTRDPGVKAKISITTHDKKLDPIGACIGLRGSRIQTISNELCGEKIDIISWNKDIRQYIINIFSPTEIKSIEINDKTKSINIAIHQEYLPKIIGKNGQNIKSASRLTKWNLNVVAYNQVSKNLNNEKNIIKSLTKKTTKQKYNNTK